MFQFQGFPEYAKRPYPAYDLETRIIQESPVIPYAGITQIRLNGRRRHPALSAWLLQAPVEYAVAMSNVNTKVRIGQKKWSMMIGGLDAMGTKTRKIKDKIDE
ncbi:hypothetical protein GCM10011571_07250 [Marinithermofilum abyssi]|uniref:Uncharacterized protein n=1 Tax=Marinithermofilum abyssi TaxID=1571185 RepID=A0A8J2VGD0_9BACL|nr:hypothetical protein GCM10011571_07250 [Marinithermofilum abyssi]